MRRFFKQKMEFTSKGLEFWAFENKLKPGHISPILVPVKLGLAQSGSRRIYKKSKSLIAGWTQLFSLPVLPDKFVLPGDPMGAA